MASDPLTENILHYRGGLSKNNLCDILKKLEHYDEMMSCCTESPYIDTTDAAKYLQRHKGKFTVLNINIQSINAKFDSLLLFLDELAQNGFHFSAICVQETWLQQSSLSSQNFNIIDYNSVFIPASCSFHSGLGIYIHKSFSFKKLDLVSSSNLWEGLFLEIKGDSLHKKINLCNVYRPPKDRNADIESFLDSFMPIIYVFISSKTLRRAYMVNNNIQNLV